jgi:hypothetical protein
MTRQPPTTTTTTTTGSVHRVQVLNEIDLGFTFVYRYRYCYYFCVFELLEDRSMWPLVLHAS